VDLERGALVTIDKVNSRVRVLPIGTDDDPNDEPAQVRFEAVALGRSADQVWPVTVWKLESGFFARDRELAAAMQIHELSTRVIPELDEWTQFFRVRVDVRDSPSPSGEIWVVFIRPPGYAAALARAAPLPQEHPRIAELRPRLLAALPDARFCFVTDDREGYARLADPEATSVAFAAAVAVVKYYAGWDESKPILIAAGHEQLAVSVDFTADSYVATVWLA